MLTAHMVVKNEDRFIWHAISSVLRHVEKLIIYDTGSTDQTARIIRSFRDKKIVFKQFQVKEVAEIGKLRNEQIQQTVTDWFWIVDGDEIYSDNLCKEIKNIVNTEGNHLEGIIVGRYDLLGDIYHYQDQSVGSYNLLGRKGHFALRLINKANIPGLHVFGNYPYEEYFDKDDTDIIFHAKNKFRFTQDKLFHAMYLPRSTQGANLKDTFHRRKYKVELGHRLSSKIAYPEVFTAKKPLDVDDVTDRRSLFYEIKAYLITPIKILKRLFT